MHGGRHVREHYYADIKDNKGIATVTYDFTWQDKSYSSNSDIHKSRIVGRGSSVSNLNKSLTHDRNKKIQKLLQFSCATSSELLNTTKVELLNMPHFEKGKRIKRLGKKMGRYGSTLLKDDSNIKNVQINDGITNFVMTILQETPQVC